MALEYSGAELRVGGRRMFYRGKPAMSDSQSERHPVDALAEEFIERFRRGERPALSEYTSKYPELSQEIRDLFPALVMLEDVGQAPASGSSSAGRQGRAGPVPKLERLGDYRILREVGRGGMGIVYEAEQESLGRHVALKVMAGHALLDARHMQRFQREARAAARLHHTNIVPVFGVGQHEGLQYYVMQFIHGQGLDQVLAELARLRQSTSLNDGGARPALTGIARAARPNTDAASAAQVAMSLMSGVFAVPAADAKVDDEPVLRDGGATSSAAASLPGNPDSEARWPGHSGNRAMSESSRQYWQSVARIGIQVADALAYAHSQNTLHRDIKPANLLLDTQGTVWVTDFGLAKASDSENLTHTGDVVGTLRYMAPERFGGKADGRSDVYALGLTLYELLTLRPAFVVSERSTLIHQVLHQDPPRPRKLNPAVPRDLETIVLKAIARDPGHRYQTAAELGEDLKRFTDDKPIRARPVSEAEKLWRWCRRNPAVAVLASAFLLALLLGFAGTGWKWHEAELQRQDATEQTSKALAARADTQRLLAGAMLDKGTALAEQGEVAEGLFWMLEGLKAVPESSADLDRVIRSNVTAWLGQCPAFTRVFDRQEPGWIAVTPDGKTLLASGGNVMKAWNIATGKQSTVLASDANLNCPALSPSGSMVIAARNQPASKSFQVLRLDAVSGKSVGPPLAHPADILATAFAPSGKQIFTACQDGVLRIWDAGTGQLVRELLKNESGLVCCLAVSPDGKLVAGGTTEPGREFDPGHVFLWDTTTAQQIGQTIDHRNYLSRVAFSPDSRSLVTASRDATAQVWDAATGKAVGPPLRHPHPLSVARFSLDGRTVVTGGHDGVVRVWDYVKGIELIGALAIDHKPIADLAFTPDGKTVVAASAWTGQTGSIHFCQLPRPLSRPMAAGKQSLLKAYWASVGSELWFTRSMASISPDTTRMLIGGNQGYASLWDTATGQPAYSGGPGGPFWNAWIGVHLTAYSPDGQVLATSSRNDTAVGEVRLWNALTGAPIGQPLAHFNYVSAMAFSPDSKILATGSYDCGLRFWDTATCKQLGSTIAQVDIIMSLAYSPDGKSVAVGHAAGIAGNTGAVLWDTATREQIGKAMKGPGGLTRFSPDSRTVVCAEGKTVRIWDARTGEALAAGIDETAVVNALAFSEDSKLLLVTSTDGAVRLRDAATGKAVGAPMFSPVNPKVAAFSRDPEGRYIVAGYEDGSTRLYDRATQKLLGPPVMQNLPIVAVAISPDGRSYISTTPDGQTRVWPIPAAAEGDQAILRLRLEVRTGQKMAEGQSVIKLSAQEWEEKRQQMVAIEGSSESAIATAVSDVAYHDARARDAEQDRDMAAARWHLTRLIELTESAPGTPAPPIWLAYARRARTHFSQDQLEQAEADLSRALQHGSADKLLSWYRHAVLACQENQQWAGALWYLNRALAIAGKDGQLYAIRAMVHGKLGKTLAQEADLAVAVKHGADSLFLAHLADDCALRGQWEEAARINQSIGDHGPWPLAAWHHRALLCLKFNDAAEYRKGVAGLLASPGEMSSAGAANSIAWICALGPDAVSDFSRPIALAEMAAKLARPEARAGVLNTLGAVLYRAGRYQESIDRMGDSMKAGGGDGTVYDWLYLAMAHHHLGHDAEAKRYFAKSAGAVAAPGGSPWDRMEIDLLWKEATQTLQNSPASPG
jgi:eukaryotic-like serine/threonine-protein kinase